MGIDLQIAGADLGRVLGETRQAITKAVLAHPGFSGACKPYGTIASIPPSIVRDLLSQKGHSYKKRSIAFLSPRSKTGKSLLAKNIAVRAAQYGYKTLAIDLDHQLDLTLSLCEFERSRPVWADIYGSHEISAQDLVVEISEHLHLIPSSPRNCVLESVFYENRHRTRSMMAESLRELHKSFEIILIDCSPTLSFLNDSVYLGVDDIVVPAVPDAQSNAALTTIFEHWRQTSEHYGQSPELHVAVNQYDSRAPGAIKHLQEIMTKCGDCILPHILVKSADAVKAKEREYHFWSSKTSHIAEDGDGIARRLLCINPLATAENEQAH